MALEKFNTASKKQVRELWYPEEDKAYVRYYINKIEKELGLSTNKKLIRKEIIKRVVKHFGKPIHISDQDYETYVKAMKRLDEW